MILTPALEVILVIFLVTAVITDFSDHCIPNAITLMAAATGLGSHLYLGGLQGAGFSLAGLAVGMGCLLPFYVLGGMGAGDVKMMGAIGAFVGPQASVVAASTGLVFGAFGGLGVLLVYRLRGLRPAKRGAVLYPHNGPATVTASVCGPAVSRAALKMRFPYALALAAGAVASLVYLGLEQVSLP